MEKEKTSQEAASLRRLIKALTNDKEAYKEECEAMGKEILSLKRKIGGYTTYTKRLKNEIANQKETIQETIRQRDTAYQTIYAQTERIRDKNSEIRELEDKLHIQENINKECIDELVAIKSDYQLSEERLKFRMDETRNLKKMLDKVECYLAKPWYKRIFIKLETLLEDAD